MKHCQDRAQTCPNMEHTLHQDKRAKEPYVVGPREPTYAALPNWPKIMPNLAPNATCMAQLLKWERAFNFGLLREGTSGPRILVRLFGAL